MIVFPNCKINIGLDIISRRPDGYHNLETVMYPVGIHDILEIVPNEQLTAGEMTLTCPGVPVDCPPEKNLVTKAYKKVSSRCALPCGVDIILEKHIPDGAGMGGGSSDAAYTIKALNSLFALGLSDEQMASMAAEIGADCPFFIYNAPMMATGTGTTLTPYPIDLSGFALLVIKPKDVSISTAMAYKDVLARRVPATLPLGERLQHNIDLWQSEIKNDFETTAFGHAPILGDIKDKIKESGAMYASMTGSGAVVYGIYRDRETADKALCMLEKDGMDGERYFSRIVIM